VPNVQD